MKVTASVVLLLAAVLVVAGRLGVVSPFSFSIRQAKLLFLGTGILLQGLAIRKENQTWSRISILLGVVTILYGVVTWS